MESFIDGGYIILLNNKYNEEKLFNGEKLEP